MKGHAMAQDLARIESLVSTCKNPVQQTSPQSQVVKKAPKKRDENMLFKLFISSKNKESTGDPF